MERNWGREHNPPYFSLRISAPASSGEEEMGGRGLTTRHWKMREWRLCKAKLHSVCVSVHAVA